MMKFRFDLSGFLWADDIDDALTKLGEYLVASGSGQLSEESPLEPEGHILVRPVEEEGRP